MRRDYDLGVRLGNEVVNIVGQTGRYMIIDRRWKDGEKTTLKVETIYITDLIDEIYNYGKEAKAVRV